MAGGTKIRKGQAFERTLSAEEFFLKMAGAKQGG